MSISERFSDGCRFIRRKVLWIILLPILLDLANLFSWEKVYHTVYNPVRKLFVFKLGFIGAPPSVNYILQDFPSPLFKYDNNGLSGMITRFSLFNAVLFITVVLIVSFLHSGYMSVVGTSYEDKVRIRDFFIKGNRKWHKFFLLDCITWLPITLIIFNKNFIYLSFINVIFVYVKYSFVRDEVGVLENFRLGISFLFNNLGLTIKMVLSFGLIFSFISVVVFILGGMGKVGIIIDIIICAYFGASANRAIFEVYATGVNTLEVKNNHIDEPF
jgi:hypothetical protein